MLNLALLAIIGTAWSFTNGLLFQLNSFDGSLIRRIDTPVEMHANILCEHNGNFTAVKRDNKTGRMEILTGSVPR